jgi:hypothetical protein
MFIHLVLIHLLNEAVYSFRDFRCDVTTYIVQFSLFSVYFYFVQHELNRVFDFLLLNFIVYLTIELFFGPPLRHLLSASMMSDVCGVLTIKNITNLLGIIGLYFWILRP